MAIALSLGTSLCYGVANYLAPLLARRFAFGAVLLVGQLAALACAAVAVAASGEAAPGGHDVWVAALAGLGNAVGLAAFLRATELGPVSIAAPIGATGAVLPVVYDLTRGHPLGALEAVGLPLAIGGVVLAARRPARAGEHARDQRASIGFAIVSAIGFGLFLIALPQASGGGRWWALLDARVALVAVVVVLLAAGGRSVMAPVAALPRLALPGVLLLTGTVLYVIAAEHGQLSIVSVCASLNPAVTVALSLALLGERVTRTQASGIALAITGVVLIAA